MADTETIIETLRNVESVFGLRARQSLEDAVLEDTIEPEPDEDRNKKFLNAMKTVVRDQDWGAIRTLRKRHGLTVADASTILDVPPAKIVDWELGDRTPSKHDFAFDVDPLDKEDVKRWIKNEDWRKIGEAAHTYPDLAQWLGLSIQTIREWADGRTPMTTTIGRMREEIGLNDDLDPTSMLRDIVDVGAWHELKVFRRTFGVSQQELAKKLKVQTQSIRDWEAGRCTPSELTQALMRQELGMTNENGIGGVVQDIVTSKDWSRMKRLRDQNNLGAKRVASWFGVSVERLRAWEEGKVDPPPATILTTSPFNTV